MEHKVCKQSHITQHCLPYSLPLGPLCAWHSFPSTTICGCKSSAKPALVNHDVMTQNVFNDLLTLTFDLGHSKSIGLLGPIRSYLGPSLKFIS